jgi:hypothetical protein
MAHHYRLVETASVHDEVKNCWIYDNLGLCMTESDVDCMANGCLSLGGVVLTVAGLCTFDCMVNEYLF